MKLFQVIRTLTFCNFLIYLNNIFRVIFFLGVTDKIMQFFPLILLTVLLKPWFNKGQKICSTVQDIWFITLVIFYPKINMWVSFQTILIRFLILHYYIFQLHLRFNWSLIITFIRTQKLRQFMLLLFFDVRDFFNKIFSIVIQCEDSSWILYKGDNFFKYESKFK